MKVLIIGNPDRYEKFRPDLPVYDQCEKTFCPRGTSDPELLDAAGDAQVILADAISPVSAYVIDHMPNLKLIHSEGVAFDKLDIKAAARRGIYVCNNKGRNPDAVAEQTLMLMLGLLRSVVTGHQAVCAGHQIQVKERLMVQGITDLEDCRVGLIGLGDIGKATAKRLSAFGCQCHYYSPHRKSIPEEEEYGISYLPLDELLSCCDIISLHMAVNEETMHFINRSRIAGMKDGALLINTGRGELVDTEALCQAIESGKLGGAGLDTLFPEPVEAENPLVLLAQKLPGRILLSPHIGGITTGSFRRMHLHMWENVARLSRGEKPDCIVNGL